MPNTRYRATPQNPNRRSTARVGRNNRSQTVTLPLEFRFNKNVRGLHPPKAQARGTDAQAHGRVRRTASGLEGIQGPSWRMLLIRLEPAERPECAGAMTALGPQHRHPHVVLWFAGSAKARLHPEEQPRRSAVSAVMGRFPFTSSLMRFGDASMSAAVSWRALMPWASLKSSAGPRQVNLVE